MKTYRAIDGMAWKVTIGEQSAIFDVSTGEPCVMLMMKSAPTDSQCRKIEQSAYNFWETVREDFEIYGFLANILKVYGNEMPMLSASNVMRQIAMPQPRNKK